MHFFLKKNCVLIGLVLRAQMDFYHKLDIWEYLLCPKFPFSDFLSIQVHSHTREKLKSETKWGEPRIGKQITLEFDILELKTRTHAHGIPYRADCRWFCGAFPNTKYCFPMHLSGFCHQRRVLWTSSAEPSGREWFRSLNRRGDGLSVWALAGVSTSKETNFLAWNH